MPVVIGSVIAIMTVTTTFTTILRSTILLWVYFCLPTFRGVGGYCNCNCDCYCDPDRDRDCDCDYYSTPHNSVAGILFSTRV